MTCTRTGSAPGAASASAGWRRPSTNVSIEMRTRLELTEQTRSSAEEEARRLREENDRLKAELEAERGKGFWRRLFGE